MSKTFDQWMKAVDAVLSAKFGFTSSDLCDICYADLYEDGYTPGQAAKRAIRNEQGYDE